MTIYCDHRGSFKSVSVSDAVDAIIYVCDACHRVLEEREYTCLDTLSIKEIHKMVKNIDTEIHKLVDAACVLLVEKNRLEGLLNE